MVRESQTEECPFHLVQGKSGNVREAYNGQGKIEHLYVGQGKHVSFHHHESV